MKKLLIPVLALGLLASCVKDDVYVAPPAPPVEDSPWAGKLVLNEINGNTPFVAPMTADSTKLIELYNTTNDPISLAGMKIYYNNVSNPPELTWTGRLPQSIPAKGYFVLQGAKVGNAGEVTTRMIKGLSGTQGIMVDLRDAEGKRIDLFTKGDTSGEAADISGAAFARVPNGEGAWFYVPQPGTKGAANTGDPASLTPIAEAVAVPVVSDVTFDPAAPAPGEAVEVSATVLPGGNATITSVVLTWTLNGANPQNITMDLDADNVYVSRTDIPAQVAGAVVSVTIKAINSVPNDKTSTAKAYTVSTPAPVGAYDGLVINEINGTFSADADKYVEFYNSTSELISLNGLVLYYGEDVTWTGTAAHTIPATGYFLLKGTKVTSPAADATTMIKGLSSTGAITLTLKDAPGNVIDAFSKGETTDKLDIARIPDGGINWYYDVAAGTQSATNGTVNEGKTPVAGVLVINEINGTFSADADKYVEFINTTSKDITLENYVLYYGADVTWTGTAAHVIAKNGGFFLLKGTKVTSPAANATTMIKGLSSTGAINLTLEDPNGNVVDTFSKGETTDKLDIARIPDATGFWYFDVAAGTQNATNGTNITGKNKVNP